MPSPRKLRKSAARQAARQAVRQSEALRSAALECEATTTMASAMRAAYGLRP